MMKGRNSIEGEMNETQPLYLDLIYILKYDWFLFPYSQQTHFFLFGFCLHDKVTQIHSDDMQGIIAV